MTDRYDAVARFLHWAIVLLIIVQFSSAWSWDIFEKGTTGRFVLFQFHLYSGYSILALALLRIVWRLTHRPPPLPAGSSRLVEIASHAVHGLLYLAIVVQPLLGIVMITAFGKSLGRWPGEAHELVADGLLVLVGLHVAGALFHQFVLRDRLIERMLPARR